MKRLGLLWVFVLLPVVPAAAQAPIDVVREERAKITAAPPLGNKLAFEVTKAVARRLNAGVLKKPTGNNQDGFSVDIVCFSDGRIFDILGDSEGAAVPGWGEAGNVDPARCQIPPPGSTVLPPPPPSPPGDHATTDLQREQLDELREQVALLTQILTAIEEQTRQVSGAVAELKQEVKKGIRVRP
jgi:hypothetical protein